MSDRAAFRLMKGGAGFGIVYLIGWASYGDVAPDWMLVATAVVALIIGIVVYIVNPRVEGIDD